MNRIEYEAPKIEVIEVEVEQGFAGSITGISGGMGENSDMGGSGDITLP